ncbi:hypothetical protein KUTeg_019181 [Tegillarca granosa]|uniref:E2F transcription factor CC-MB domain-containing protein n=1 Tax=Tegillarca granosa TaxID=220873 RepID=A0ABQ9EGX2_TEGGR|nr:hypothetical protein KUTeg_019181 [Tegillarca granosa]
MELIRLAYVTHDDICKCFKGDTLLAIQAPSGTQLEVPIPEIGPGFKKNYQIHLKSHSGPIHVLLVNKDTDATSPVVVQVPPPKEDIVTTIPQNQNIDPNQLSDKTTGKSPLKQRSPTKSPLRQTQPTTGSETSVPTTRMATRSSPRKSQGQTASTTYQPTPTTSQLPTNSPTIDSLPTDILFDPPRSDLDMEGDLIEELMSSEAFAPLLRLSPPPSDRDYYFNLDDSEGACDLFDVPLLTM